MAARKPTPAKAPAKPRKPRKPRWKGNKEQTIEIILEGITYKALNVVCREDPTLPTPQAFLAWVRDDEALYERYTRAMKIRADRMLDEILEIADDKTGDLLFNPDGTPMMNALGQLMYAQDHIQRAKLKVHARQWMMGRMNPSKYSDKQQVEHTGGVKSNITVTYNIVDPPKRADPEDDAS